MTTVAPKTAYLGWLSRAFASARKTTPERSESTDLVLGYATGYDAAMIAPFVRSLRSWFDGTIALVVDQREDVLALLEQHDVVAVHPEPVAGWEPHAVVARFSAYADLIERWPDADSVFVTDVRDVVFQGDPFQPRPAQMEVFNEWDGGNLGGHAFNTKHLTAVFGEDIAASLADKACLCVGTIIGPRDDVLRLCRTMLMLAAIPRSEIGGAFGADQAVFNMAIHFGLVRSSVQPNYRRVATIGMTPGDLLHFHEGKVVNPTGGISPIVHQHDRHPHLADPIHSLWGKGLRYCARTKSKTAADRGLRLQRSLMRRLPELR